jgi:LysM repeat protein
MSKSIGLLALSIVILLVLPACTLSSPNSLLSAQPTAPLSTLVTIDLTVHADTSAPLNAVGQLIKYGYRIKAKGSTTVSGNVSVTAADATCPPINTIGNKDNSLDGNETLVCTSTHAITQADLDAGSVTTVTTATVGALSSKPVATTVQFQKLSLTKTANPVTYDHAGQTITYTYVIQNSSAGNLGPAQFIVSDEGIPAPINCGDANTTLTPNATVTCTTTYAITAADINAVSVTHAATATGNAAGTSQSASTTITKSAVVQNVPNPNPKLNPNPNHLAVGSTVQHKVADGEWIWQIARCFGTDPKQIIQANPQLTDPEHISPNIILAVPNIGSRGPIYDAPCVVAYTVQSGDTWASIAQKYNADPAVLQMVNSNGLAVGKVLNVPLNSAGN